MALLSFKKFIPTFLLILGLSYGAIGQAQAACCGWIDTIAIVTAIQTAATSIVSAITASTTKLIFSLKQSTSDVRGDQNLQMAVTREAAQAKINQDAEIYMKEKAVDTAIAYRPQEDLCASSNGGVAMARAVTESKVDVSAGVFGASLRNMGLVDASPAQSVAKLLNNHASKYCTAQDEALGRCTAVEITMRGADLSFREPIDGTETYTDKEVEAAQDYTNLALNPIPATALPKAMDKTKAGAAYNAAQMADTAALSAPTQSFQQAIAERTNRPGLALGVPPYTDRKMSELQLLRDQAELRFMNKKIPGGLAGSGMTWYESLASAKVDTLLRMLNEMMALKVYLAFRDYERNGRIERLLAIQTAQQIRDSADRRNAGLAAAAARQSVNVPSGG